MFRKRLRPHATGGRERHDELQMAHRIRRVPFSLRTGRISLQPAAAKTALISGTAFGGLSVFWGVLLGKGFNWAKWAALATTLMLCAVFSIRSFISWQKVMADEPKTFAASLITLMLLGSLATVARLIVRK